MGGTAEGGAGDSKVDPLGSNVFLSNAAQSNGGVRASLARSLTLPQSPRLSTVLTLGGEAFHSSDALL